MHHANVNLNGRGECSDLNEERPERVVRTDLIAGVAASSRNGNN